MAAAQANITTRGDQKGIGAQRGPGGPGGPGFGVRLDSLAAAATYLGISQADLQTKVQSGQSLAQIAAATAGKSRDGLIAALVADAKDKVGAAHTAGPIAAA